MQEVKYLKNTYRYIVDNFLLEEAQKYANKYKCTLQTAISDTVRSLYYFIEHWWKNKPSYFSQQYMYDVFIKKTEKIEEELLSYILWYYGLSFKSLYNKYTNTALKGDDKMNNRLKIFENKDFGQVRAIEIDGKIMFCGKDVAKALGYSNACDAMNRHCKSQGVVKHDTLTNGGTQKITFISEGNLYRLITHSKLPSAEKFEAWVFEEVLPSIRQHGLYATEETTEKILNNPDFLIKALETLKSEKEKRQQLETEIVQKNQIIGELQSKANYADTILNNKSLVTITQIAKDYGMSGKAMNDLLHTYEVHYKESGQWLLYKKYHNKGYTHSKTIDIEHKDGTKFVKMNTKWTQKGRLFIYELLKKGGILPVIEQQEKTA